MRELNRILCACLLILGALPIALRALGRCRSVQNNTTAQTTPQIAALPDLCPHFWVQLREAAPRDTKKRFYLGLRWHPIPVQCMRRRPFFVYVLQCTFPINSVMG
uniref:Putative secreted peptide n=1 Tax=Anopheles braziliensis TaxID=58242 RepID=A0A2M3ZWE7_9DIPT